MDKASRVPKNVVAELDDGETIHYICRHDESVLVERIDDGRLGPPELVGPALPKTHGAYVQLGESRSFFSLDEQSVLQEHRLMMGDVFDAWEPGNLADLGIRPSPSSEIAAASADGEVILVFFQADDGHIQSVCFGRDGRWALNPSFPATVAPKDASLCALSLGDKIHVFYTHEDKSIHDVALANGIWTDSTVPLTNTNLHKSSLRSAPSDQEGEYGLEYMNEAGEVIIVENGRSEVVRLLTEHGLVLAKGAEGYNGRGCRLYRRP